MVAKLAITDQNEPMMQLIQQIAKMRVEMQRIQYLPPLCFTANASTNGMSPLYFLFSNMEQVHNTPSTSSENPMVINLTAQNPQYA